MRSLRIRLATATALSPVIIGIIIILSDKIVTRFRRFVKSLCLTAKGTGLCIVSARLAGGLCGHGLKAVILVLAFLPLNRRAIGTGAVVKLLFAIGFTLVVESPIAEEMIFVFDLVLGLYAVYNEIAVTAYRNLVGRFCGLVTVISYV